MDSKVIFTKAIDTMTDALDSIGLYVIDCNMSIQSTKQYANLDDLRSDVINNNASIVFDVDCFMGKAIWRSDQDFTAVEIPESTVSVANFIQDIVSIDIGDIASYIMEKKKEQDETLDS